MADVKAKRAQMLSDLRPALAAGEKVLYFTGCMASVRRLGNDTKRRATLAVTDRRVLIFSKKMGGYDVQDFAFGLLTGVDHKKGVLTGDIHLRGGGDTIRLEMIASAHVEQMAAAIRERMAVARAPQTSSPAASTADEIRKLAQLHADGILSADEFAAAKKRLLG